MDSVKSLAVALVSLGVLGGCSGSDDAAASNLGGSGGGSAAGGSGGAIATGGGGSGGSAASGGSGVGCDGKVTGTFRDFRASHPDFECTKSQPYAWSDPENKDCGPWDPAIVGALGTPLGADDKPTYAGGSGTPSTTGAANFAHWFNDVPGTNARQDLVIQLTPTGGGTLVYDTDRFFPIDGVLFDAEANNPDVGKFPDDDQSFRNFHFSYELHTTFRYEQGNVFTFRGDDDVFVYIDKKLAVNIGGIHVPMQGKLNLDTGRVELTSPLGFPDLPVTSALGFTESIAGGVAGTVDLNLTPGEVYAMDFFFVERNCCASNFRIETNFEFIDCGVPR